ncbi:hypothetical protein VTJ04DRAFT_6844 [Mycothermus thermophilus]|uniref:uncharacterized protein n=1 Tax=Humicola insolens TaxID=85995 RepID=UPI0037447770
MCYTSSRKQSPIPREQLERSSSGYALLVHVLIYVALSTIDIGFNAAGGAAAVATGAHVSGLPLTSRMLGIGAVAGITKAGILAFFGLFRFAKIHIGVYMLLLVVTSMYGICVLITLQVANTVLGHTPSELLIAAVVAAIPLSCEGASMYLSIGNYRQIDELENSVETKFEPCTDIWVIGWDALGGYVFARMAQNQGMPICPLNAAAAAGAVFGTLSCIPKMLAYCCWYVVHTV